MDNLEKKLNNLPQAKLRWSADLKIRIKLYTFIIQRRLQVFFGWGLANHHLGRRALALATLVLLIFGSTSWYAYANDSITQGNALYPLKRVVETVKKQTAFTPDAKVKTHEQLSERRLQEAVILSQQAPAEQTTEQRQEIKEHLQKSIDEAVSEISSAAQEVRAVDSKEVKRAAAERLEEKERRRVNYLEEIEKKAEERQDEELKEKIKGAKEAVKKYRELLREQPKREPAEENKKEDGTQEAAEQKTDGLKINNNEQRPERAIRRQSGQELEQKND